MRHRFDELKMLILMDLPEHERLRKLVRQVFTKAAIANLEPLVTDVVTSYVEALAGRTQFDLVKDFAALFPVEIISSMLGVPDGGTPADPPVDGWLPAPRTEQPVRHRERGSRVDGDERLTSFSWPRRSAAGPTTSSSADSWTATYEDETGVTHRLTDEDIGTFAVLLAAEASETVTKLMGNGIMAFHNNPDQWERCLPTPA